MPSRMEYQTAGHNLPQNLLNLNDFEVPCAVCQRISAAEKGVMIPGIATSCPSGFVRQEAEMDVDCEPWLAHPICSRVASDA